MSFVGSDLDRRLGRVNDHKKVSHMLKGFMLILLMSVASLRAYSNDRSFQVMLVIHALDSGISNTANDIETLVC